MAMMDYVKAFPPKYVVAVVGLILGFLAFIVWQGGSFSGFGIDIEGEKVELAEDIEAIERELDVKQERLQDLERAVRARNPPTREAAPNTGDQ